jgi:hypothetical protein
MGPFIEDIGINTGPKDYDGATLTYAAPSQLARLACLDYDDMKYETVYLVVKVHSCQ